MSLNFKIPTPIIVFLFTLLLTGGPIYALPNFKKIAITESNNAPYFLNSGAGVFAKRDLTYLQQLKSYVEAHGFPTAEKNGEVEFVLSSLKWVSSQWDHDGMNEPAKGAKGLDILKDVYERKIKYRCVEYGLVLSDVLQAYGFVTRSIALRSIDVAYGGPGSGHVATEVWANSLGKWIFLDGQFGLYLTAKGHTSPLDYYEISQEKKAGRWSDLELHFLKPSKKVEQDAKDYKAFLINYFGYMSVSDGSNGSPRVSLLLESHHQSVTFQGMQQDDVVFTDDAKTVYPEMNRVTVILKYRPAPQDFQALFAKLKIKNSDDYLKKMGAFAAVPDFVANLKTTEPFFDRYEYRIDSKEWSSLAENSFAWKVEKSSSRLEARAVNKFGRPGPTTYLVVTYE